MVLDKITETIAHFAGFFDLGIEEVRARETYKTFHVAPTQDEDHTPTDPVTVTIKAPFDLEDFDPYIPYAPVPPVLYPARTELALVYDETAIEVPVYFGSNGYSLPRAALPDGPDFASLQSARLPTLEPRGSVAVVIKQHAAMSDDDVVSLGHHGLTPTLDGRDALALDALAAKAMALVPFADVATPGTAEAMKDFVVATREALDAVAPGTEGGAQIFVAKAATLDGFYVNGEQSDAIPDFKTYRPDDPAETKTAHDGFEPSFDPGGQAGGLAANDRTATPSVQEGQGPHEVAVAISLEAGANTLVNSVALTSSWLAARVTAVAGDHVEVNAIVQVNVWSDVDQALSALAVSIGDDPTSAGFNIAAFQRIDPANALPQPVVQDGDFPSFWVVTQVNGDLLIFNWIEQLTFMSDSDVAILSASGSRTEIVTGDNLATNQISLDELGHYYDLIVVTGSIYDANFIYQMNVLLDDDVVAAADGFAAGAGSGVSTTGNLLWNQAGIVNVGAADRFDSLAGPYRDAVDGLAAGDRTAPDGLLSDPLLAGSGALKVLYITGDIINLQFVKQVNVLGDSDDVTLAIDAVKAAPDAQWTVSTGANTLVNFASITDVDALGHTLVGGTVYSDEILIQAELVPTMPDFGSPVAAVLVTEAVLFLGDSMLASGPATDVAGVHIPNSTDMAPADPMQTMLA